MPGVLQVNVLGPLEVVLDGVPVPVPGLRLRVLLIRLATAGGRSVSAGALIDAVWGDEPPADPANALQSLVSRLRRVLGQADVVVQGPAGYRLAIDDTGLDVTRFTRLAADGSELAHRQLPQQALDRLTEALGLWRGPALVDAAPAGFTEPLLARWEEQRLTVARERLALLVDLGRGDEAVPELEQLVADHPFSEPVVALLMRALTAAGRQPEAVQRFADTRRFLADELGTDPGPELQALHLDLLQGRAAPPSQQEMAGNLRVALTSFVGRDAELARLGELLSASRLTTVVGTGGAGKTRIATEGAATWSARTRAPAWVVELAPVTQDEQVTAVVLAAIGGREARITDRERIPVDDRDRLLDRLRSQECLIVMDNCEHLLEETARVLDDLLAHAPGVRVLATSREPLAITGEVLFPLGPLPTPELAATVDQAAASPAVRLWLDRARATDPGFRLDEATVGPVVEIVRRLDGLPLAIELAAARLRVLPVTEIAARLGDRFRLLTGGNRVALPRHRTLRAVVAWSWDLLTEAERLLAERLAVFPAGTDRAGATAVCSGGPVAAADVDDTLNALVDKSLLVADLDPRRPVRFRMLETIREYGIERLADRGELDEIRSAHARYLLDFVLAAEPRLRRADQLEAIAALDAERDNIAAALRQLVDAGQVADAMQLCLALTWYWSLRDVTAEAAGWLTSVVEMDGAQDEPQLVWAQAALTLSELSRDVADSPQPWSGMVEQLSALAERLVEAPAPEFPGLAALRPVVAMLAGRLDLADQAARESLESPDPWLRAAVHAALASMAENDGDPEETRRAAEVAYAGFAEIGDRWGLSASLSNRARVASLDGRLDDAVADFRQAAVLVESIGSRDDLFYLRMQLAGLLGRSGDRAAARAELVSLLDGTPGSPAGDRALFAEAALLMLDWPADPDADLATRADGLRRRVLEREQPSPLAGHAVAIVLSTTAFIAITNGGIDRAAADLEHAYRAGVGTRDMPVLAAVGLDVAALAAARGRADDAATVLGACAQIRGADDPGDLVHTWVQAKIEPVLGAERYAERYAAGRQLDRAEAIARLDPVLLADD